MAAESVSVPVSCLARLPVPLITVAEAIVEAAWFVEKMAGPLSTIWPEPEAMLPVAFAIRRPLLKLSRAVAVLSVTVLAEAVARALPSPRLTAGFVFCRRTVPALCSQPPS